MCETCFIVFHRIWLQIECKLSANCADESIRAFRIVASLTMLWACVAGQGSRSQCLDQTSEIRRPSSSSTLDDQRFIAFMISSELSSVVVLKFRRLYDRQGYDNYAMCSLIFIDSYWFFTMQSFES